MSPVSLYGSSDYERESGLVRDFCPIVYDFDTHSPFATLSGHSQYRLDTTNACSYGRHIFEESDFIKFYNLSRMPWTFWQIYPNGIGVCKLCGTGNFKTRNFVHSP